MKTTAISVQIVLGFGCLSELILHGENAKMTRSKVSVHRCLILIASVSLLVSCSKAEEPELDIFNPLVGSWFHNRGSVRDEFEFQKEFQFQRTVTQGGEGRLYWSGSYDFRVERSIRFLIGELEDENGLVEVAPAQVQIFRLRILNDDAVEIGGLLYLREGTEFEV